MNRFELARPRASPRPATSLAEKAGSVLQGRRHRPPRPPEGAPRRAAAARGPQAASRASHDITVGAGRRAAHRRPGHAGRGGGARGRAEDAHRALAEACGEAASPQIRNVATIGGNVLQRPRCWYYRLESYKCLKKGGDVCYAVGGENRYHVIFGGGPSYAAHPSNAAVALVALGATFVLEGAEGRAHGRRRPSSSRRPSKNPRAENPLGAGEILTEIRVPAGRGLGPTYDDVRERAAFDWPLVSMAAAVRLDGGAGEGRPRRAGRGGARSPGGRTGPSRPSWASRSTRRRVAAAARAAIVGAAPLSDNGYKVGLVQTLVRRTLLSLA